MKNACFLFGLFLKVWELVLYNYHLDFFLMLVGGGVLFDLELVLGFF